MKRTSRDLEKTFFFPLSRQQAFPKFQGCTCINCTSCSCVAFVCNKRIHRLKKKKNSILQYKGMSCSVLHRAGMTKSWWSQGQNLPPIPKRGQHQPAGICLHCTQDPKEPHSQAWPRSWHRNTQGNEHFSNLLSPETASSQLSPWARGEYLSLTWTPPTSSLSPPSLALYGWCVLMRAHSSFILFPLLVL